VKKKNPTHQYRNLFFISLSFIVLFACVAFYLLYQSQQSQFWNDHRRKMEVELEAVLSGVYEMEASKRGYLLTGRLESIVPYKQADLEVTAHLANVYSLVIDNESQKQGVDTLADLVQKRKKLFEEVIALYKESRYVHDSIDYERIKLLILQGDEIMNKIRVQVKSLIAFEQYLVSKKVAAVDNFNSRAYILIICFGLITIVVSLYGYLIVQRENRQKQAVEVQLMDYYSKVEKANITLTEAEKLAQIGSWEWDIETGKVQWSNGTYKVYNVSPDDFIPTYDSFIDVIHKDDKAIAVDAITKAMQEKKSYHIEFRETISTQNKIIYAVGLARLDNKDNLVGYFGIIADITRQRNYEKQLEDFNTALKKSNEELEQFAYVASHDLQEPLRKIRAFGDRLMFKYEQQAELPGHDYIIRMMDGAERMQVLIQDLLAFSRVSRDAGDKTIVDLNETIKSVLEDLQLSISESNAKIEIEHLPKLASTNPVQMQQLFLNLIGNAIKFHKENSPPEIHISYRIIEGALVHLPDENVDVQKTYYEITVHDNGIGFDEKYRDKIFTIFQRLHGRSEYKGTGIGLAVCKKICHNHGGYITAKSDGESGSDFIIYLPK
jgi:signal transduction histidine kinase/CHASE3 domain sensor protein